MIILRQALDRRARISSVIRALVLMIFMVTLSTADAQAQQQAGGNTNTGKDEGAAIDPNTNNMTGWSTRDNYFKRYPFASSAYQHDQKSLHHRGTVENAGNTSFLDGLFGDGSDNDFSSLFGGSSNPTSQAPVERLQQSDPPAAGSPVTAYPFYIKFCNDNPYQGVCYWQMGEAVDTPAAARDMELFENVLTTFGYPVSDTQFQIIQRENFQRLLELLYDPERNTWMMTNTAQIAGASASNSLASASENAWNTCLDYIMDGADGTGVLINVANERSATPIANPNVLYKQVSEAIYMVQRMYREVFVPMAILFLLPGAVVTQVKATVRQGFNIEQTPNPFEGILRSIIAVFLIPATQVIVSYSIDVGNSMADACKEWVDIPLILDWSHELTYNVKPENHKNVISPPEAQGGVGAAAGGGGATGGGGNSGGGGLLGGLTSAIGGLFGGLGSWISGLFGALMAPFIAAFDGLFGSGGDGIAANIPENQTIHEDQLALSQYYQGMVNGTVFFVSLTIIMLTAFQLVYICYLYLLGPLSAALFAWPIVSSRSYFRAVFGKWVEAIICISLWRFYWVTALAIMTQRLVYIGGGKFGTGDLQWEAIIFCCSLGLMLWSAMNPFIYDPANAAGNIDSTAKTGQSLGGGAGGGGGGGGGDAGGGGGDGGGGADNTPQVPSQTAPSAPSTAGGGSTTNNTTTSSSGPGGAESNQTVALSSSSSGGPDGGGGGSDSDSSSSSGGPQGAQGPDSASPDTSLPPSASSDGAGAGGSGSGDAGGPGGSDGGGAPDVANLPPSADGGGGGGDAGGGGGEAMQAAADCGLPTSAMPSDGPPVGLGPSSSGPSAVCNSNADYASAAASAAAQGATAAGGAASGAGSAGEVALNIDVSGSGGDDSGGGSPPQAAPPVPPPPSFGEDA